MGTSVKFFLDFFLEAKKEKRKMVSFADRKIIVGRMDKQFEEGLRMRKDMNNLNHRAVGMTKNLQLLQKDFRGYSGLVGDLRSQASRNAKSIEEILNRPDMKKLGTD